MKYFKIKYNDIVDGEGICVSLWTAGCPHHCKGCFNEETWDYNNGVEVPQDLKFRIIKAIQANGIQRNFSVLGGEPFTLSNREFVLDVVRSVRIAYPNIMIYIWSGYTYEELKSFNSKEVNEILENCDVLIDGRYEEDKRDLTLKLRGSSNQNIIYLKGQE